MNRKSKIAAMLATLFVMSATLFGVKWKRDNPTPTTQDLSVRKRFLEAKDVILFLDNQPVEGPDGGDHHLSLPEKQQIAEHLWVTSLPSGVPSRFTTRAIFSCGFGGSVVLDFARFDYYSPDMLEVHSVKLHPATSRYLRQWLAEHPVIEKQIALK